MTGVRPLTWYGIFLSILGVLLLGTHITVEGQRRFFRASLPVAHAAVSALGLSDLCLSTEARYIRHAAVSDPVVPFMDHPGGLEHFPSGTFWAPVRQASVGTTNP